MIQWGRPSIWLRADVWAYLALSFDGRIPRKPFWIALIILNVASFFADAFAMRIGGNSASAVASLAFLYPLLALAAKRAHDRGRSELYLMFFFLPAFMASGLQVLGYTEDGGVLSPVLVVLGLWLLIAMIALLVDLGLMAGDPETNAWGPPP